MEFGNPPTTLWDFNKARDWVRESIAIDQDEHEGVRWLILIPFVCFEIWKARYRFIFDATKFPPPQVTLKKCKHPCKRT